MHNPVYVSSYSRACIYGVKRLTEKERATPCASVVQSWLQCRDAHAGEWVQCYLLELVHDLEDMLPLGQLRVHLFAASCNTGSIDTTTSKESHCLLSKLPEGINRENETLS